MTRATGNKMPQRKSLCDLPLKAHKFVTILFINMSMGLSQLFKGEVNVTSFCACNQGHPIPRRDTFPREPAVDPDQLEVWVSCSCIFPDRLAIRPALQQF